MSKKQPDEYRAFLQKELQEANHKDEYDEGYRAAMETAIAAYKQHARESARPDEWIEEVLEILAKQRNTCLFNAEVNECGTADGWRADAVRFERLIATAPKRESGEVPGWFNKSAAMADAQKVCNLTKEVEKWHSAAMKAGVIVHTGGMLSFPVDYVKLLEDSCWDLRCVDVQSGYDDGDIEWQVVGHWMAKPQERIIGRGSSAIAAIKDAMQPRDHDGNLLNVTDEDQGRRGPSNG